MYLMGVQVGSALTATGVYPYSATITVNLTGGGTRTVNLSGYVPVVARDSSPYGAGWGIDGIPQLYPITANGTVPAGLLWVDGSGDSRFFISNGNGTYSNAEDFGSLVQQGSNYVYTAKDQTVYNFSSAGQLTSVVDASGLTTSYTYTSGLLTGVTAPDGGSTVLRYDTHNFLYQVTEPGSRNFNLTQTEVQVGSGWQSTLTQISDVDNTTRTLGYNSLHQLTSDSYAPEYSSFSYDSNTALLNGVTLGQSTTQPYAIASAASFNLTSTSTLSAVPGVVGAGLPTPAATVTDGNNHTTQYLLDTRGRLLQQMSPLGETTTLQLNTAGDPTRTIDPLGYVTADAYNTSGDLTQETLADGRFTIYQYDPKFHEVTQTTNSLGETTTAVYDQTTGLITSSTDALGNTTSYVWANGRLQSTTDPLGHMTLNRYDSELRPVFQINSLGNWSGTTYDSYGNVASMVDAQGWMTDTSANARGLVLRTTDPNGAVDQFQYYADGSLLGETNARGFTRTVTIDARGLTTSSTDYLAHAVSFGYDAAGNMTTMTDANGNASTNQFDADNRLIIASTPLGEQTQYSYDADSNRVSMTDAAGNVTHEYYDLQNRDVLSVDPLGLTQYTVYGPTGENLGDINQIGAVSRTIYDTVERPIIAIDPLGNTSQTSYNADNLVVAMTDARGFTTHYLYNPLNELTATIDPNNFVTRQVFNSIGEVIQSIDANGHATSFAYDPDGRNNQIADANGNKWQTVFDVVGAPIEAVDADGNISKVIRDGDNRVISTIDGAGNQDHTTYDPAGNAIQYVDAGGHTWVYQYNQDNEQTAIVDPNAHEAETVFDKLGQVVAAYDGNQNGTYSGFDSNGQKTGAGLATGASTIENYNGLGQVTQEIDPDNNRTSFLYNLAGVSVGMIDPLGHAAYTAYNADYQPIQQVDRDGRVVDSIYDNAGRLTSQLWLAANGAQADSLAYTLDSVGNLTAASNNYGSYQFDPNGNRAMTGYQTGPGNQITTDGSWNYKYDPEGNVVEKDGVSGGANAGITWVYAYNNANQMISATKSSGGTQQLQVTISYDVFGNRVEEDVIQDGTTTVTRFAQQVVNQRAGWQHLPATWADLNGSNQLQARREFLSAVDSVFARIASTGTEDWYLGDHLSSIRGLMNNSGTLDDAITYSAWGQISSESNAGNGDRYKFADGQWDTTLALQLNQARFYDPAVGRWISEDPLGLGPDSNPFRYTSNDPTVYVDPTGCTSLVGVGRFPWLLATLGLVARNLDFLGPIVIAGYIYANADQVRQAGNGSAGFRFPRLTIPRLPELGPLRVPEPGPAQLPRVSPRPVPAPEPWPRIPVPSLPWPNPKIRTSWLIDINAINCIYECNDGTGFSIPRIPWGVCPDVILNPDNLPFPGIDPAR